MRIDLRVATPWIAAVLATTVFSDDPSPGFAVDEQWPVPPIAHDPFGLGFDVVGMAAPLSDGRVVTFDGQTISLIDASGAPLANLGTITPPSYPSIVRIAPSEDFALVGESSSGGLWRVDLPSGGLQHVADVPLGYDVAFLDEGRVLISAAPCSTGCGTELVELELATGQATPLATVSGSSGPLAIDDDGNVFYGTVSAVFGAQGSGRILRFGAERLGGPLPIDEDDATVVGVGYDALSSLAFDRSTATLLAAENNIVSGTNRIVRVAAHAAKAETLVHGPIAWWITQLHFTSNGGSDGEAADFAAYQPELGGTLVYQSSSWTPPAARLLALSPKRAVGSVEGPGVGGLGSVDYRIDGGPAFGFAAVVFGPAALWSPLESTIETGGLPPLQTGLDLPTANVGALVPLFDAGQTLHVFENPGTWGAVVLQSLLFSPTGAIVATSTATTF